MLASGTTGANAQRVSSGTFDPADGKVPLDRADGDPDCAHADPDLLQVASAAEAADGHLRYVESLGGLAAGEQITHRFSQASSYQES